MTRRREEPLLSRAEPDGASRNGGTPTGTLQALLLPTTHLAAQEAAVSELSQEEGNEEVDSLPLSYFVVFYLPWTAGAEKSELEA